MKHRRSSRRRSSSTRRSKRGLGTTPTYKTFLRSARNWEEFSSSKKRTVDRGLTYDEARRACQAYNKSRTPAQVRAGTKLEFEQE